MDSLVEVNIAEQRFSLPLKRIYDSQGALTFQSSLAIYRLKFYLHKYTNMARNVEIPSSDYVSKIPIVNEMSNILMKLSDDIDSVPAFEGPRRYGNLACRDWHRLINSKIPLLLENLLKSSELGSNESTFEKLKECIIELEYYFSNSFGSSVRLDYGTGHELSFLAVIAAIDMLGLWTNSFSAEDFLHIFHCYYELVKKLILTYTLEPAGSHGVWGLDDHFHLAYLLGSSQLVDDPNPFIKPSDVVNKKLVQEYADRNFYCNAISFIYTVKSGPFSEHSPMLFDISRSVRSWSKVNSGLSKMYMVEVLSKFPVVQHFWFGDGFYPWINVKTKELLQVYENDTNQENNTFNSTSTSFPNSIHRKGEMLGQDAIYGNRPSSSENRHFGSPNRESTRQSMGPPNANFVSSILSSNSADRFRKRSRD